MNQYHMSHLYHFLHSILHLHIFEQIHHFHYHKDTQKVLSDYKLRFREQLLRKNYSLRKGGSVFLSFMGFRSTSGDLPESSKSINPFRDGKWCFSIKLIVIVCIWNFEIWSTSVTAILVSTAQILFSLETNRHMCRGNIKIRISQFKIFSYLLRCLSTGFDNVCNALCINKLRCIVIDIQDLQVNLEIHYEKFHWKPQAEKTILDYDS